MFPGHDPADATTLDQHLYQATIRRRSGWASSPLFINQLILCCQTTTDHAEIDQLLEIYLRVMSRICVVIPKTSWQRTDTSASLGADYWDCSALCLRIGFWILPVLKEAPTAPEAMR
jgi:hypothetical protein